MRIQIESVRKGAELTSIRWNGIERLHDGKVEWNRHSPILFPMVGRLRNDQTQIDGKTYHMKQHGFARDMEFETIEYTDKVQSYLLKSNEITREKYPYDFIINVTHIAKENEVTTQYKIINTDNRDIYFGIGAHPAYKMKYEDCYLEFEKEETNILCYQLEEGLIAKQYKRQLKSNKILELEKNTFDNDAIIMQNVISNKLYIKKKETNEKVLEFYFRDFPYLAIWSKQEAPFLCLEPWYTTADEQNSNGEFIHKQGTICLKPSQEFVCEYSATFW